MAQINLNTIFGAHVRCIKMATCNNLHEEKKQGTKQLIRYETTIQKIVLKPTKNENSK